MSSKFRLSVRTSMLSEFRDSQGALGAFELSREYTTLVALCSALAQIPGVRFESDSPRLWSSRPRRFTYDGRLYEVSLAPTDYRIAASEPDAVYPETEELLLLVKRHVVSRWRARARSRFSAS